MSATSHLDLCRNCGKDALTLVFCKDSAGGIFAFYSVCRVCGHHHYPLTPARYEPERMQT